MQGTKCHEKIMNLEIKTKFESQLCYQIACDVGQLYLL